MGGGNNSTLKKNVRYHFQIKVLDFPARTLPGHFGLLLFLWSFCSHEAIKKIGTSKIKIRFALWGIKSKR